MTLLIPPQFSAVVPVINEAMALHKMTSYREIEPKAGCRRFELTR